MTYQTLKLEGARVSLEQQQKEKKSIICEMAQLRTNIAEASQKLKEAKSNVEKEQKRRDDEKHQLQLLLQLQQEKDYEERMQERERAEREALKCQEDTRKRKKLLMSSDHPQGKREEADYNSSEFVSEINRRSKTMPRTPLNRAAFDHDLVATAPCSGEKPESQQRFLEALEASDTSYANNEGASADVTQLPEHLLWTTASGKPVSVPPAPLSPVLIAVADTWDTRIPSSTKLFGGPPQESQRMKHSSILDNVLPLSVSLTPTNRIMDVEQPPTPSPSPSFSDILLMPDSIFTDHSSGRSDGYRDLFSQDHTFLDASTRVPSAKLPRIINDSTAPKHNIHGPTERHERLTVATPHQKSNNVPIDHVPTTLRKSHSEFPNTVAATAGLKTYNQRSQQQKQRSSQAGAAVSMATSNTISKRVASTTTTTPSMAVAGHKNKPPCESMPASTYAPRHQGPSPADMNPSSRLQMTTSKVATKQIPTVEAAQPSSKVISTSNPSKFNPAKVKGKSSASSTYDWFGDDFSF